MHSMTIEIYKDLHCTYIFAFITVMLMDTL